jgi:PAS domain S-box-containing protein
MSRDDLVTVLETVGALIVVMDTEGRVVLFNHVCERLTGFSSADVLGKPFWDVLLLPEERDQVRKVFHSLKAGHFPNRHENYWLTRSGGRLWIAWSNTCLTDGRGGVEYVIGTGIDMTERRRLEAERMRLTEILGATPDLVATASADGQMLYLNRGGFRLLEWDPEEGVAGRSILEAHPKWAGRKALNEFLPAAIRDGEWRGETTLKSRTGKIIPVSQVILAHRDASGRLRFLSTIMRDISERKRTEAELTRHREQLEELVKARTAELSKAVEDLATENERRRRVERDLESYASELARSNQDLERFAFVASHDLQEPLRKIHAFGDLLERHLGGCLDEKGQDLMRRMLGAGHRMQGLIEALLRLSRVSTQGAPFGAVDLNAVMQVLLSDLEPSIESAGGQVDVMPLPRVKGDETQIRELFQNLVCNALKFRRSGVPVRVRVYGENGQRQQHAHAGAAEALCACVVVEDNGIGFDQKHAERIFEVFQRLHQRSEYEGTGIGLAISRKIVERHGGSIEAYGKQGEGARFVVTLPLAAAEAG